MPVDGEGGYACEVYTCEACDQLVCEDCQKSPGDFLQEGEPSYLIKYFLGLGFHPVSSTISQLYSVTYCRACLSKVEIAYVEAIPVGALLLHTGDEWLWDEGRALYLKRLSQGE